MSIEILLKICQVGMFVVQWVLMAVTSLSLLKSKEKNKIKAFVLFIILGFTPAAISRLILPITKRILLNTVLCSGAVILVHILLFQESMKKRIGLGVMELLVSYIGEFGTAYLLLTTAHVSGIIILIIVEKGINARKIHIGGKL